jgi:valyl-tRNA synthetase
MVIQYHEELPKAYNPREVETKLYQFWLDGGYFSPRIDHSKKPFVIIMPPPNVTGELHVGHALTATLEDTMVRWHRMKGEPTLWLPGVDHAGIATQVVVEQQLAREGLTRHELGREKFLERVWQWVKQCRNTIAKQHMKMGASCDWGHERFTLDESPSRAVYTTFVNLYSKGLIYNGERIINWCPRCHTALSDLEIEHREITGHLYYIKYPLANGVAQEFITVATTRPETMLGDTAVAVNPDDRRFKGIVGEKVILPIIGRPIAIIADDAVDPAFGTGAVKITPAHDPVDFEVAKRQNLPLINILNPDATLNQNAGPYAGFDRFACREAILEQLQRENLLIKTESYLHSVGHCARCDTIVEPLASRQWFIKMESLAEPAIRAVLEEQITIIPKHFTKVFLNWMENIRDWCISRQLWWGHRIPVWYCRECGQLTVAAAEPEKCSHCGSEDIYQDPDVLDTWFSSALWPHSTLGWPDDTEELRYFYPTTVMETGYDILFFWVARMIMMGLENTGKVPFRTVYLHGLVRDEVGEKMSKLKGNVLNPLDAIEQYGADALRFALTTGSSPGNDVRISTQKLESGRNFANKLWNAARFVIRSIDTDIESIQATPKEAPIEDRWILSRLNRMVANVNQLLEDFQFGEGERQIHDFIWGEFCDWYIEIAKTRLRPRAEELTSPLPILAQVLETTLRLLHPFMPFITEEIWQSLIPHLPTVEDRPHSIMVAPYPIANEKALDPQAEEEMESIVEIIRSIRNARAQFKVEPAKWIRAEVYCRDKSTIKSQAHIIEILTRVRPLTILNKKLEKTEGDKTLVLVLRDAEVSLPLSDMLDLNAERQRLEKDIANSQNEIARLQSKLQNHQFLSRAPCFIVEREQQKLDTTLDKLSRLREQLARL